MSADAVILAAGAASLAPWLGLFALRAATPLRRPRPAAPAAGPPLTVAEIHRYGARTFATGTRPPEEYRDELQRIERALAFWASIGRNPRGVTLARFRFAMTEPDRLLFAWSPPNRQWAFLMPCPWRPDDTAGRHSWYLTMAHDLIRLASEPAPAQATAGGSCSS